MDVAARREARRRNILENADKRLQKLTGVEQKSEFTIEGIKPTRYNSNSVTGLGQSRSQNSIFGDSGNDLDLSAIQRQLFNNSDSRTPENEQAPPEKNNTIFHLFGIALVLNILLLMVQKLDITIIHLDKYFVPLICYEIALICSKGIPQTNSSNPLVLLLLMSERYRFLAKYLHYIQYVFKLIQDTICYFVFFTTTWYVFALFR